MKVKDFIEYLKTLDPETVVKVVDADPDNSIYPKWVYLSVDKFSEVCYYDDNKDKKSLELGYTV